MIHYGTEWIRVLQRGVLSQSAMVNIPKGERIDAVMNNTTRFFFKSCAKCGGDMVQDRDFDGYFRKCLQCGRIIDLGATLPQMAATSDKKLAA